MSVRLWPEAAQEEKKDILAKKQSLAYVLVVDLCQSAGCLSYSLISSQHELRNADVCNSRGLAMHLKQYLFVWRWFGLFDAGAHCIWPEPCEADSA